MEYQLVSHLHYFSSAFIYVLHELQRRRRLTSAMHRHTGKRKSCLVTDISHTVELRLRLEAGGRPTTYRNVELSANTADLTVHIPTTHAARRHDNHTLRSSSPLPMTTAPKTTATTRTMTAARQPTRRTRALSAASSWTGCAFRRHRPTAAADADSLFDVV